MNKSDLKRVYMDTIEKCSNGKFKKLNTGPSTLFPFEYKKLIPKRIFDKTYIEVINEDTLLVAQKYALSNDKDDKNLCALNMASADYAGGGAANGARAQEEQLFYRTTYHKTLKQEKFYPFKRPNVIYSEKVWVIKDKNYNDMANPFAINFIAGAAPRWPDLTPDGEDYAYKQDCISIYNTIENIFRCAYYYGHTTLILGALGCGAYSNPQKKVIEIFNEILTIYDGCFKNIIFAVYSRNDRNYDLFSKHIKKLIK